MADNRNTWEQFYATLQRAAQSDNDAAISLDKLNKAAAGSDDSYFQQTVREVFSTRHEGLGFQPEAIHDILNETLPWRDAYVSFSPRGSSQLEAPQQSQSSFGDLFKGGNVVGGGGPGTTKTKPTIRSVQQQQLMDQFNAAIAIGDERERAAAIDKVLANLEAPALFGGQVDIVRRYIVQSEQIQKSLPEDPKARKKALDALDAKLQVQADKRRGEWEENEKNKNPVKAENLRQDGVLLSNIRSQNLGVARQAFQTLVSRRLYQIEAYPVFVEYNIPLGNLFSVVSEMLQAQREDEEQSQGSSGIDEGPLRSKILGGQERQLLKGAAGKAGRLGSKAALAEGAASKINPYVAAAFFLKKYWKPILITLLILLLILVATFVVVANMLWQFFFGEGTPIFFVGGTPTTIQGAQIVDNAKNITNNLCRTFVVSGSTPSIRCDSSTNNLYDNINPGAVYPQPYAAAPSKESSFKNSSFGIKFLVPSDKNNKTYYWANNHPFCANECRARRPWGRYWCTDLVIDSFAAAGRTEIVGWTDYNRNDYTYLWDTGNVTVMMLFFQNHVGNKYMFLPASRFDPKLVIPGSAIFFKWDNDPRIQGEHTGIVARIDQVRPGFGTIYTLEANTPSRTHHYSYQFNNPGNQIVGFGIPLQ